MYEDIRAAFPMLTNGQQAVELLKTMLLRLNIPGGMTSSAMETAIHLFGPHVSTIAALPTSADGLVARLNGLLASVREAGMSAASLPGRGGC